MAARLKRQQDETLGLIPTNLDPRREYLAGGILNTGASLGFGKGSILVGTNDDLMREFGYSVYSNMVKDPKVSKCVKLIKVSVLGDGVDFIPNKNDNDPEYDNALLVANFCNHAVKSMKKPLRNVLEQMLDAVVYGHKIAEIVYKYEQVDLVGKTCLVIDSVKPKPIGTARFVVDNSMNLLGITGTASLQSNELPDMETVGKNNITEIDGRIFIKTEGGKLEFQKLDKFLVLTIDTEDEDPRGRSMLRSAFNFWNIKNQIIPEYLRYLLTCSIPLLVGFTPETGDEKQLLRDTSGTALKDSSGRYIEINPVEALREALMQARNATALALKGGSQVKEISANGSGIPFYKAIEVFDSQIEMSILLQTLASSESRFNTRAASETHMTVLDQLIWSLKGLVADMLTYQLLKPLIKYNFGESWLKYMPVVNLGDSERRNFSLDGATVATLFSSGYMSEDQKRYTDAMLGLPIRDANYDPLANITPDEALRYSNAVLEQSMLEAEIKKTREASNLERVNQIVGLQKTLETVTDPNVRRTVEAFIISVLNDIEKDKLDNDVNRVAQTFINAGVRAKQVLSPDSLKSGKIDSMDLPTSADTNIKSLPPLSGNASSAGNMPYISVKSKPKTFSKRRR